MNSLTGAQRNWLRNNPEYSPVGEPQPGTQFVRVGTLYPDGTFELITPLKPLRLTNGPPYAIGVGVAAGAGSRTVPATEPWAVTWMGVAKRFSRRSKDPSTKVGCVVVGPDEVPRMTGVNGLPRKVRDLAERMERPAKYLWTSHAEENAVAQAARVGSRLNGCTIYTTHFPCSRCARSLIQAGIVRVVYGPGKTSMPPEEFEIASIAFQESGVICEAVDDESL